MKRSIPTLFVVAVSMLGIMTQNSFAGHGGGHSQQQFHPQQNFHPQQQFQSSQSFSPHAPSGAGKFCGTNSCQPHCGNNGCWPYWPGLGGGCYSSYPVYLQRPNVVVQPVVIEVPGVPATVVGIDPPAVAANVVAAPPGDSSPSAANPALDAEKLPQVPVGGSVKLPGPDLGDKPGQAFLQMDAIVLPIQVTDWKSNGAALTLPFFGLQQPIKAAIVMVRADGQVARQSLIELLPAQPSNNRQPGGPNGPANNGPANNGPLVNPGPG